MTQDLATENQVLQEQLEQLWTQVQENQRILQRHQSFDLQCIAAGSLRELIDTILYALPESANLDVVTLALLDPDYGIRRIVSELNIKLADTPRLLLLGDEQEFGALAPQLSSPVLGSYAESLHGALFPDPVSAPASVAIVPLIRHGRLIGSLNFGSRNAERFTPQMATDFIGHMASIVAICLENVINIERLKHIGLTDPLTGVHNRRYLERRLSEEIGRTRRQGYALSCLYIDIDHFKQINDLIGHQAGDEVLRGVAGRIKTQLRLSDALSRFGGEEFVALLIDTEYANALIVAERVRLCIADQPFELSGGERVNVTISIGVAALTVAEEAGPVEESAQAFIARADQALYRAKQGGRDQVVGDA